MEQGIMILDAVTRTAVGSELVVVVQPNASGTRIHPPYPPGLSRMATRSLRVAQCLGVALRTGKRRCSEFPIACNVAEAASECVIVQKGAVLHG
jgi:hypothetical protein